MAESDKVQARIEAKTRQYVELVERQHTLVRSIKEMIKEVNTQREKMEGELSALQEEIEAKVQSLPRDHPN